MKMLLHNICKFSCDLLFPNRCPACDKFIHWDKLFCDECLKKLADYEIETCIKCGKPICVCDEKNIEFDGCISALLYKDFSSQAIINFKKFYAFNLAQHYSDVLIKKLKNADLSDEIDLVIAVPMHKNKLLERGYNQSDELAKIIAKKLNKKYNKNILIKNFDNVDQHSLTYEQRKESVKGLYSVKNKEYILNKNILLCDDIYTTGSTLNECAKVLKENGCKKIFCVALATT